MLSLETIPSGFKGTKHTIERMHDIVLKAKMQPYVKTIARMMSWGCPEKDRGCKARKIFGFLKGAFLYEHDPENIELIASPMRMFQSMNDMAKAGMNTGGKLFVGDCDDASILVSSLAGSLGVPYRFETIKGAANSDEFTHVYAGLMVDGGWHGADLTVPSSYFGWRPQVPPEKLKVWSEPER